MEREAGHRVTAVGRAFLLDAARRALVHAVETGCAPAADQLALPAPPPLPAPHGVFVSLHRGTELRGCRGRIRSEGPLHFAVIEQTAGTALADHRFAPIRAEELPEMRISLSLLGPPRRVAGPEQVVLGRHGIILSKDGRQALFLPRVAVEQGWSLEVTLSQLARKAGLAEEGWREGVELQVFDTQRLE